MDGSGIKVSGEVIVEKDGKVIEKKPFGPKSFVKSFAVHLLEHLVGWDYKDSFYDKDVGTGVLYTVPYHWGEEINVLAPSGEDQWGIRVGTSSQAVSPDDVDLIAPISHGTGAGQLLYGDSNETHDFTSLTMTITIQRYFDNNSGSDITVNEIGLFLKLRLHRPDGTVEEHITMWARDVITATTVPNGGRLTVKYTIQINP